MSYRIEFTAAALRQIGRLSEPIRRRIYDRAAALAEEPRPRGSEKLSGYEAYRIRVGDYRVVYTIEDDQLLVTVVRAGHRRDVYRGL